MAAPRMIIVAGPSGGGKSSLYSIFDMQVDAFSTDLRAATLLGVALDAAGPVFRPPRGAEAEYMNYRAQAGREMERFIDDHIARQESFAFETTLRDATFVQARQATRNGFRVRMIFVAAGDAREHIRRVTERGARGGHVASEERLIEIYERGMAMLCRAFDESRQRHIDALHVIHNPRVSPVSPPQPSVIVRLSGGTPTYVAEQAPDWFHAAVRGTPFELTQLRRQRRAQPDR